MSVTGIRNLTPKEFLLHKYVLPAYGDLTLNDAEVIGDWEILRPLNWAVDAGDVTTSGSIIFPDWTDYPGGVQDQPARNFDIFPGSSGGARFLGYRPAFRRGR